MTSIDIPSRIGPEIAEIGTAGSANEMNFDVIGEIPGNIAGGIGRTQTSCPVGALPSPFDDDRAAVGSAVVMKNPDTTLTIIPNLQYTVHDTIDLCPGNCGAEREQIATVPLSRLEASGVSGDVPFTVHFSALPQVVVARPAVPPPTPPPGPTTATGEVTASALRIRGGPSTAAPIHGRYPRGTVITILCETTGTMVEGDPSWLQTNDGFVSGHYVRRLGPGTVPPC